MLYLAGIFITFFLAIILLTKKGKTVADKVLAVWLCVMGFHLFLFYLHITETIYQYPYLLGVHIPLPLLQGPLLYIYVLTETRYNSFRKIHLLHFLPVILAYVVLSRFFLLSEVEKIDVYKQSGAGYEVYTNSILIALTLSGFVYVLLSFYELNRYKKKIVDEFSNTEKINLNWLRYLIYGILAIWLVVAFNGDDALIFAVVVVFVVLLGYFGVKHVGIFTYQQSLVKGSGINTIQEMSFLPGVDFSVTPVQDQQSDAMDEPGAAILPKTNREEIIAHKELPTEPGESKAKYERSGLQQETAEKIYTSLTRLMQSEKMFTEAELSLASLANHLQVHPNNLSQVINSFEHKNFYDYINSLRIEEFKRLASRPENRRYTLLSLAFECGFNSKTAFNRNFRKITGQSPSEYLEAAQIQLQ